MKPSVIELCNIFKEKTGYSVKFLIMHDNVIGLKVDADEPVKKLAELFFRREGYKHDIADMAEYFKRHPESEQAVDFGVYGKLF